MSSQPLPVGQELRRAREDAGLELADVAAHLRIRSNFLSALEEGRPDALPGITYAIGYVRTYAAFLGLEPDAAVRRFKEEAAGLNSKTQLVFPSPAPEGRVPGLLLMLVAAMLVGGAYGGWYWLSERDGNLRDLVPAVPERLAQLIEGEAPPLPGVSAGPGPAADSYASANPTGMTLPPPAPGDALPSTATADRPAAASPAAAPSGPVASAPQFGETIATPPPAVRSISPAPSAASQAEDPQTAVDRSTADQAIAVPAETTPGRPVATPASPPPPATVTPGLPSPVDSASVSPPAVAAPPVAAAIASDEASDVTAPPEPSATSLAAAPAPRAATEPEMPAAAERTVEDGVPAAPRIGGLIGASEAAVPTGRGASGPVDRVLIRATGDSWVQVRDAQGTALFTRVLREGDIYRVPDQAGLRLATGNAGALQILVDGNPAPGLGDFGEVVRNVMLDPSLLAAGTASGATR